MFVVIDRISKFVHDRLYQKAGCEQAADFLEDTAQQLPYRVHTVLTNNGTQFAKRHGNEAYRPHRFDVGYREHGIKHCLTLPFHPKTDG